MRGEAVENIIITIVYLSPPSGWQTSLIRDALSSDIALLTHFSTTLLVETRLGHFLSDFSVFIHTVLFVWGVIQLMAAFYWSSNFCSLVTAVGCNWSRYPPRKVWLEATDTDNPPMSVDCHWVVFSKIGWHWGLSIGLYPTIDNLVAMLCAGIPLS